MTFLEQLRDEFEIEMQKTQAFLERVPEDRFAWQPHAKSMTLGRLTGHIAELPRRAAEIVRLETLVRMPGHVPYSATAREEMLERFAQCVSDGRSALQEMAEDQLPEIWRIKFGEKVILELPRVKALRAVCLNHLVHHRGQLSVYLRLLDVPVPGMYGPSADEK